jgi:hypothetical protein
MAGHPPLGVLQSHGFSGAERIALFPLLLLDPIADALLLACDPEGGNNLLAHYKLWFHRGSNYDHQVVAASGRSVSCEGTRVRKKNLRARECGRRTRCAWNTVGPTVSSVGDSSLGVRTCPAFLDREGRPLRRLGGGVARRALGFACAHPRLISVARSRGPYEGGSISICRRCGLHDMSGARILSGRFFALGPLERMPVSSPSQSPSWQLETARENTRFLTPPSQSSCSRSLGAGSGSS